MSDLVTISEVIVAAVKVQTAAILTRCEQLETRIATLETRAAEPGPPGPPGAPGPPGEPGPRGQDAEAPADELDADAITAALTELLRKELGDLTVPVTRKRTVRDATGAVKYEIEET